jgi:hypothetical protein
LREAAKILSPVLGRSKAYHESLNLTLYTQRRRQQKYNNVYAELSAAAITISSGAEAAAGNLHKTASSRRVLCSRAAVKKQIKRSKRHSGGGSL